MTKPNKRDRERAVDLLKSINFYYPHDYSCKQRVNEVAQAFADVRAEERERCAEVADETHIDSVSFYDESPSKTIAQAIRQLGDKQ